MVTISASDRNLQGKYGNTQFRYAMTYVVLTLVVLLLLNVYSSKASQRLFYQSKETSMVGKCLLAASEIGDLDVMSRSTVARKIAQMDSLRMTRLVVTDQYGMVIYDTQRTEGSYALLPEVVAALEQKDVFTWNYHDGVMLSRAATPILSAGTLVGCVYMLETDAAQGAMIRSLQYNILSITLILVVLIFVYSLCFSRIFSKRIQRFMESIRTIRSGDYGHRVNMGGHDELHFLAEEFNDLTEKLQTSEEKRSRFVSDASHELKTPLASIKLLSDSILQNDMDMETVREFVSDIGNEADRLNKMSLKLLTLSDAENQASEDCEIIKLAPTVERAVRMLSGIAEKSGIRILTDLEKDSPVLIPEDDLYQIVFNLIENGIKYNTSGGKVTVTLAREEDNAILRIADNGVGIPKESLGKIFDRFYRVDKARSRKSGSSGLGLSIVRGIVERNQGAIRVTSELGKGSVFTVSFPVFDTEEVEQ